MKFNYYDIYDEQFEDLVVAVCQKILGIGVKGFAKGPDGGRDARFEGKAGQYPSTSSPLEGKIIIQAKHTEDPIAKFSDTRFSGDGQTSVLNEEIPKVAKLVDNGELDHYFLFTNRRLTADADATITEKVITETGAKTVHLFGVEALDGFLRDYPDVRDNLKINPVDTPLRASPDELANIVVALNKHKDEIAEAVKKKKLVAEERTQFTEKNEINGLSEEYAGLILRRFLKDFDFVKDFLENPGNENIYEDYQTAVDDFNAEIIQHKAEYHAFDDLLNFLFDMLCQRDRDLSTNRRLTRLVLYYMYWSCDIGENKDA